MRINDGIKYRSMSNLWFGMKKVIQNIENIQNIIIVGSTFFKRLNICFELAVATKLALLLDSGNKNQECLHWCSIGSITENTAIY